MDRVPATADREIVFSRLFDARRELVWKAWTDPDQLAQWWGPRGFTNTFQEIDVKPGGVWRLVMHGPDGTDYPNHIVFDEVVEPERLVYTNGSGTEGDPVHYQTTVTFAERGGQTAVTMRMVFPTVEEHDRSVEHGVIEGGNQTLDRLAEQLEQLSREAGRIV